MAVKKKAAPAKVAAKKVASDGPTQVDTEALPPQKRAGE